MAKLAIRAGVMALPLVSALAVRLAICAWGRPC
jgi:hypothetical protein